MEKRRLRGKRSPSTLGSPGVGVSAAQTDAGVSPFESPCDTPAVGTPEHDVASPVVDEAQSSDAPVPAVKRKYKHDLVGAILDVTYTGDESGTFRVEVIKYDQPTGWHHVNSTGLSEWDGESFTDLIDINSMACEGLIRQAGWRHPITKDSNHQHGSAGRGRGKPKKAAVPPAMKECLEFQKKSPEHAGAALQMKKDKLKDHKKSVTSKNGPSGSSSVDAALLGMMLDIRYPGDAVLCVDDPPCWGTHYAHDAQQPRVADVSRKSDFGISYQDSMVQRLHGIGYGGHLPLCNDIDTLQHGPL